jgi:hypothetical protein
VWSFVTVGWFGVLLSCWHWYIQLFQIAQFLSLMWLTVTILTGTSRIQKRVYLSVLVTMCVKMAVEPTFDTLCLLKIPRRVESAQRIYSTTWKSFIFRIIFVNKNLWNKTSCKTNPQKLHGFCSAFLQCLRKPENCILRPIELCPAVMNVE